MYTLGEKKTSFRTAETSWKLAGLHQVLISKPEVYMGLRT